MYRNWGAAAVAASLLISTAAFGGTDSDQGALPAGKPATVKQAQSWDSPPVIAASILVIGGGIAALATTGGNGTTTTTGTTTAP
jgi:hypothetical protein